MQTLSSKCYLSAFLNLFRKVAAKKMTRDHTGKTVIIHLSLSVTGDNVEVELQVTSNLMPLQCP